MYGYVAQPNALRFHGPAFLALAIVRLLPRPHLIVNLTAPPQVIRERKQELTLSQIEHELVGLVFPAGAELDDVGCDAATR